MFFESLQVNQNTKTTHQKDLTKNETPLSLTISKKPKIQLQITNHSMMITGKYRTHTLADSTTAAGLSHGLQLLWPV